MSLYMYIVYVYDSHMSTVCIYV